MLLFTCPALANNLTYNAHSVNEMNAEIDVSVGNSLLTSQY